MSGSEVDWSKYEGWHPDKPFEFYTTADREIARNLFRRQSAELIARIPHVARDISSQGLEFTTLTLDNGYAAGP